MGTTAGLSPLQTGLASSMLHARRILHRRAQGTTFQHLSSLIMRGSTYLLAIALVACRPAGRPSTPSPSERPAMTQQITAQLERAASDWNSGDLEGFLSDYAAESTTTFVDGRRARHGIGFIRQNYSRWFAPRARRDSLHFEEVEVRPLGADHALVTARFVLQRSGTVSSSGPFTLVMERRSGDWKIVHDHSSSDPR